MRIEVIDSKTVEVWRWWGIVGPTLLRKLDHGAWVSENGWRADCPLLSRYICDAVGFWIAEREERLVSQGLERGVSPKFARALLSEAEDSLPGFDLSITATPCGSYYTVSACSDVFSASVQADDAETYPRLTATTVVRILLSQLAKRGGT